MKKKLSVDEMITLLQSRNVKFNNEYEKILFCEYLEKYNYVMIVSPYKVMHASSIEIGKGFSKQNHFYDYNSPINSKSYIKHYKRDRDLNVLLYKEIGEFESIFSSVITKMISSSFNIFFNNIELLIQNFVRKYANINSFNINSNIRIINSLSSETRIDKIDNDIYYFVKDNKLINYFLEHNNKNSRTIYSFLNNTSIKATFNDKISIFKVFSDDMKNNVIKEILRLSNNLYNITDLRKFILDINSVRFIRNIVSHHNSISYILMHDTRKSIIKYRYKHFNKPNYVIKFNEYNLGRVLKFFNNISNNEYLYYEQMHNKTIKLYDPKYHCKNKGDVVYYAKIFNINL